MQRGVAIGAVAVWVVLAGCAPEIQGSNPAPAAVASPGGADGFDGRWRGYLTLVLNRGGRAGALCDAAVRRNLVVANGVVRMRWGPNEFVIPIEADGTVAGLIGATRLAGRFRADAFSGEVTSLGCLYHLSAQRE